MHPRRSVFRYRNSAVTAPELHRFANGSHPTHNGVQCLGPCPIHQPSNHQMKDWPMVRRLSGLIERLCPHNVGHPDPDSVVWLEANGPEQRHGTWGVHGCCWEWCCCQPEGKVRNR